MGSRRASVVLLGGELMGRLAPKERRRPRRARDRARTRHRTDRRGTSAAPAAFRVVARSGRRSRPRFAVFEGRAEIETGGRKVVVGPNRAVTIAEDGTISAPFAAARSAESRGAVAGATRLSRVVRTRSPSRGLEVETETRKARKKTRTPIASSSLATASSARSSSTSTPLVPSSVKEISSPANTIGGSRRPGAASTAPSPSAAGRDRARRRPPSLAVAFPAGPISAGELALRGTVEPGARGVRGARPGRRRSIRRVRSAGPAAPRPQPDRRRSHGLRRERQPTAPRSSTPDSESSRTCHDRTSSRPPPPQDDGRAADLVTAAVAVISFTMARMFHDDKRLYATDVVALMAVGVAEESAPSSAATSRACARAPGWRGAPISPTRRRARCSAGTSPTAPG